MPEKTKEKETRSVAPWRPFTVKEENYYKADGSFIRTLELPKDVHVDKIRASFKNGILEVRLPKTEEAKAKEIKVKVD